MTWKKFTTYTLLTASTGIAAHLLNKFTCIAAVHDNLLNTNSGEFYDWRFGKIYYEKTGKGKPILLIHDLDIASSSHEWYKIKKQLTETNTVYTIDLLGCGRSDKPNFTYTNFLYVQLITDFIKNVIKEPSNIIATGESSAFVLNSAFVFNSESDTDNLIDKIILINPVSLIKLAKIPTDKTKILQKFINTPIIGTLLYNVLVCRKYLKKRFCTEYYYDSAKIIERDIDIYFESTYLDNTHSKYLFSSMVSRYTNANILISLKKLKNSIFILTGNGNPENITIAEAYQNQMPSIEIIGIENTKHLPQLEKPKEVIEQINILFQPDK